MHQQTELLVAAIESLRQEPNYFKDYIFPIASAFFTSLLGAGIAYFTLKNQEGIQIEKEKMNAANKWTLQMEEARATLIAIKGTYNENLTENPYQRVSAVQSILFHAKPIDAKLEELSFIIPKSNPDVTEYPKWSQITRIRSMVNNYNYLLQLWNQRNEIERPLREYVIEQHSKLGYADIQPEDLLASIGASNAVVLIDITERVIKLTDDLLLEIDDFLSGFPVYAKTRIKTKKLKSYGSVVTHSNKDNPLLLAVLQRTIEPNFTTVEDIFGETSDAIIQRLKTGYE